MYMYDENTTTKALGNQELYGSGFTYAHRLADDPRINREDVARRIEAKEFDLVVYGAVQRGTPMLDVVTKAYGPSRVVFVDGDDWRDWQGVMARAALLDKGVYFMREMPDDCPIL
jgi:hypothetical protein